MGGINGPLQWESSEWRAGWWAMRPEKRAEGRIMQYHFYSKSSEEPLIVWSSGDCFKPEWAWGQRSGVVAVLSRVRIAPGPGSEDGNQGAGLRNVSQTEQAGLGSDCQERHGRTGVRDESHISAWVGQLTSGGCYYLDVESSAGLGRLDVWESAMWCWWPFVFFFFMWAIDLNDSDNHDGVITDLEPDILDGEVKWDIGSITTNKASLRRWNSS